MPGKPEDNIPKPFRRGYILKRILVICISICCDFFLDFVLPAVHRFEKIFIKYYDWALSSNLNSDVKLNLFDLIYS